LIDLCQEVVKTFEGAYERNINVQKHLAPIFVLGHEDHLKQIIYILIDNGLKYSADAINVNIFEHDNAAILQVIDFGEGIPEDEQRFIFDRFYRMDKARSR